MLRTVLGGDGPGTDTRGPQRRRPLPTDDPDLAAAWEELESYLDSDQEPVRGGTSSASSTSGASTAHPREPLRADYATLGVAFDAPMSEVKRAYKRLMRTPPSRSLRARPRPPGRRHAQGRPHQHRLRAHRTRSPRHQVTKR